MESLKKSVKNPVIVSGYKRSGTTMFRLMLNAHPELAIAPESEYFQRVPIKLGKKAYKPEDSAYIAEKLSDMKRSDFKLGLTKKDYGVIIDRLLPASAPEIIAGLYKYWAEYQGKAEARWGDKKPQNWQIVYRLKEWYPESQFIHIVRDPRDVFASIEEHFPEQIIGRKFLAPHLITAWQWRKANKEMLKQGQRLGPLRFLEILYEEVVNEPEKYCRQCCKFLRLEYTPEMLSFQKSAKNITIQGARIKAHQNTVKEVHTGRIGRFKQSSLSNNVIAEIEYICSDMFDLYGWRKSETKLPITRKYVLRQICKILDFAWFLRRSFRRLGGSL